MAGEARAAQDRRARGELRGEHGEQPDGGRRVQTWVGDLRGGGGEEERRGRAKRERERALRLGGWRVGTKPWDDVFITGRSESDFLVVVLEADVLGITSSSSSSMGA